MLPTKKNCTSVSADKSEFSCDILCYTHPSSFERNCRSRSVSASVLETVPRAVPEVMLCQGLHRPTIRGTLEVRYFRLLSLRLWQHCLGLHRNGVGMNRQLIDVFLRVV